MRGWLRTRARNPIGTAAATAALLLLTSAGSAAAAAGANGPGANGPGANGPGGAPTWRIGTLAGGVGGPAPASQIAAGDCALSFSGGNLYASGPDYINVIRKISMATGQLTTAVGAGFGRYGLTSPDGTPAGQAAIFDSCGVTTDTSGNLFFTDQADVIEMMPATAGTYFGQSMIPGHVYTIGGNGTGGYAGDGGPATEAKLSGPAGVTVDPDGNVIIDDSGNNVLRLIAATSGTFYGQVMTAGDIYTVAGGGTEYNQSGIPATSAFLEVTDEGGEYPGVQPWPLVTDDRAGNIVLFDGGAAGAALVEVVAGQTGTFYGRAMTAGDIYVIGGDGSKAPRGIPARQADLGISSGVALDHAGNILISDADHHQLFVIAVTAGRFYGRAMKSGYIYPLAGNGKEGFAGDGGPAARAEFSGPDGVAVDSAGNVVLADGEGGGYDAIFSNGRLRVIAEKTGRYYGVKMTAGDIYTISGSRGHSYYGDGGPAGKALLVADQFYDATPNSGVAATRSGGMVFADLVNNRIRIVPAVRGTYFGRHLRAGDIYTVAGNGQGGYAGDRGPATQARLNRPAGVAVDASGNVVLADTFNNRVRVVATRAGRSYGRAMKAGDIYTIAGTGQGGYSGNGGLATSARLHSPEGLAVDHHGNVIVADALNSKIRVIAKHTGRYYGRSMRAGHIYAVASRLTCSGAAVDAAGNVVAGCGTTVQVLAVRTGRFYGRHMVAGHAYAIAAGTKSTMVAEGVAVDRSGNVLVADSKYDIWPPRSGVIQVIAAKTGTFYGVAMTAGRLYIIAGAGTDGLGDGGLARRGRLSLPTGVAVAPSGAVFVLDDTRVRAIRN